MNLENANIVITTGGTGGHIFPALSLGVHLKNQKASVVIATDKRGINWLQSQNNPLETICFTSSSPALSGIFNKIKALILILQGTLKALLYVKKNKPDLVIGFGSYASFPIMLAALFLNIPIMMHEQNAVLGKTNRFFAKRAKILALSFENTALIPTGVKTVFTGMPVRNAIAKIKSAPLQFEDNSFKILVTGGSQGASIFSDIIPQAINALPDDLRTQIEVVQQCRESEISKVTEGYQNQIKNFRIASFFNDMPNELKSCNLVICRAGSSTIAELATVQRPAILVPLPYAADNHQAANARAFCKNNGGWFFEQKDFSVETLCQKLTELIKNADILVKMAQNIKNSANIEAVKNLEKIVNDIITKKEF
ncbi:MAG: undecaprenyldiphospho-muramoylpentapeptide beta-N-acetylglucosaminyltransferase [Alphaproteobacteria bacterium]